MNTRKITLLTAVVLALGTGYLTITYLGSLKRQAGPAPTTMRSVIVAAVDIAPRAKILPSMLKRSSRALEEIDPDSMVDAKLVIGKYALISVPAGSTITQSKIGRPADTVFAVRIPHGMRAVSIAIDRVKGVSGLVEPGDHVDVIAIPPKVGTEPRAYTIIRGAVVMALGNQLETAGATPNPVAPDLTAVTLAVTPQQADLLSMADINTTLRLALRPPEEATRSLPAEGLVFSGVPDQPAPAAAAPLPYPPPMYAVQAPPPVAAPRQAAAAPSQARGVTVIDGDHVVPNVAAR